MDLTNLVLTIFEKFAKTYSVILRKPYISIKVQYAPRRDRSGQVTKEMMAFTITNEGVHEIEIQRIWLVTSFNRPIFSELLDSKMPLRMLGKDKATYFLPMAALKAALNRVVGDTIVEAIAFDKTGHKYAGRVDRIAQEEFGK
jgi:hypothetical protein